MPLVYGLDVFTPTTIPGDDPWKPMLKSKLTRWTCVSADELIKQMDALQAANPMIRLRAVELQTDDPVYTA